MRLPGTRKVAMTAADANEIAAIARAVTRVVIGAGRRSPIDVCTQSSTNIADRGRGLVEHCLGHIVVPRVREVVQVVDDDFTCTLPGRLFVAERVDAEL